MALTGVLLTLVGCKKDETEPTDSASIPKISVSEPKVYTSEAATYTLYYEIENPREGVELELTSAEEWISDLGADRRRISFTLSQNGDIKTRIGNIKLSYEGAESETVEIAQSGIDQSVIIVNDPETVTYMGSSVTVDYSIENPQEGVKLQATSKVSWITGVVVKDKSLTFNVSKNTDKSVRSGKIELTYGNAEPTNVTVRQQAFENAVIKTSSSSLTVDAWGDNGKITYSITNPRPGAKVTARSGNSWIKNIVVGDGEVTILASFNTASTSRSGSIVLEYEEAEPVTVTVTQSVLSGTVTSLGVEESANCYIVTKPGVYKMPAVKGNDKSQKVAAASVEVLWETRSDADVKVGDIVNHTGYDNGNIYFNVNRKTSSSTVPEGNALIAAKDASGNILWSWHIWVTSVMPTDHQYKNGAGTMMVCDLGAAYVESGAYPWSSGLYYQYGRKDPFWGDQSCTLYIWKVVESDATTGTESYAAAHPTTFITNASNATHWLHSGKGGLWRRTKSISDPCPPGYVVPDGGQYGVWARASGWTSEVSGECSSWVVFNGSGADLEFRSAGECWYRPNGYINYLGSFLPNFYIADYPNYTTSTVSQYWSGTWYSKSDGRNYVYCYRIVIREKKNYGSSTGIKYSANPNGSTSRLCEGYLVRCMKKQ